MSQFGEYLFSIAERAQKSCYALSLRSRSDGTRKGYIGLWVAVQINWTKARARTHQGPSLACLMMKCKTLFSRVFWPMEVSSAIIEFMGARSVYGSWVPPWHWTLCDLQVCLMFLVPKSLRRREKTPYTIFYSSWRTVRGAQPLSVANGCYDLVCARLCTFYQNNFWWPQALWTCQGLCRIVAWDLGDIYIAARKVERYFLTAVPSSKHDLFKIRGGPFDLVAAIDFSGDSWCWEELLLSTHEPRPSILAGSLGRWSDLSLYWIILTRTKSAIHPW